MESGQNVMAGGRVVASKRVQADLLTGQIGGQYTSRTYALFSDNYFTPVGYGGTGDDPTQDDVRMYVFNPTSGSIDVV